MNVKDNLNEKLQRVIQQIDFSGTVLVKQGNHMKIEVAASYANRSEQIANNMDTRFGIASGCKLFTAIAVCQLVEEKKLSFDMRLKDCLNIDFPHFDSNITVHQLLTHSSGIPDYFDEEVMDDYEQLWQERPVYLIKRLNDFLPMFQNESMKFNPGEKFHYNNAGYIILGLIVEQHTNMTFTHYVETNIFKKAGMVNSGYFSLDRLPQNCALGYIDDTETGEWRTNIYSVPIVGGAEGGAFISSSDMIKCWKALQSNKLLGEEYTSLLLYPHIHVDEDEYYGYGVWMTKREDKVYKYHVMGYDPGISFHSAVYPSLDLQLVISSNKESGAYDVMKEIESQFN